MDSSMRKKKAPENLKETQQRREERERVSVEQQPKSESKVQQRL